MFTGVDIHCIFVDAHSDRDVSQQLQHGIYQVHCDDYIHIIVEHIMFEGFDDSIVVYSVYSIYSDDIYYDNNDIYIWDVICDGGRG